MVAAELFHQLLIERLGETRVRDGGRKPEAGELVCSLERLGQPCTEGKDFEILELKEVAVR